MYSSFNPSDEFHVNTTTAGEQGEPSVVVLESGNYVITWSHPAPVGAGAGQVRAQIYARDGSKIGSEFVLNTAQTQYSPHADLVALPGGGFVAAWAGTGPAGADPQGIVVQIFNGDGSRVGTEFIANNTTFNTQFDPAVALLSTGNFVVTWTCATGVSGVSLDYQVMGQIFTPAGVKVGSELVINPNVSGYQQSPDVAALAGGGFVVTWTEGGGYFGDSGSGVAAQIYSDSGARVGSTFLVNTIVTNGQGSANIAALSNGNFVVSWLDGSGYTSAAGFLVKAQLFNSQGAKIGGEILIDTSETGYVDKFHMTTLAGGGFIVAWAGFGSAPTSGDVHARMFDDNGAAAGGRLELNAPGTGSQFYPFIAASPDGGFIAAYTDARDPGTAADAQSITARTFAADRSGSAFYGTASGDDLQGGGFDDFVGGYGGADTLSGGAGADLISGGDGDDLLDGGAGADRMAGGGGNDIYIVDESGDLVIESGPGLDEVRTALSAYTLPNAVENLTGTSAAGQTLTGNALNNALTGGSGNDTLSGAAGDDLLDGGAGLDTLIGGAGNDSYVDNDGDTITEAANEGTADEIRTAAASYTLHTANVENLRGTSAVGQALTGDGLNNRIEGAAGNDVLDGGLGVDTLVGGAGNDVLHGGDGNDKLDGGAGSDALYGEAGNDTLTYRADPGSGDVDTADGGAGFDTLNVSFVNGPGATGIRFAITDNPGGGHDGFFSNGGTERVTFSGIETFNVTGTDAADEIGGGSGNDLLVGLAGDDLLTGGAGADLLIGAEGNDTMAGGTGNDLYLVSDAGDVVIEAAGEGYDEVDTELASYTLGDNVEKLAGTLATGQSLTGNGLANTILGFTGNDILDGGAGADALDGYTGNDIYMIDDAGDTITDASGTDEVRTALASFSLAPFATVENLTGIADTGQTLTGNGLANTIRGGNGGDMLNGGVGIDALYGNGGDDILDGGTNGDRMEGGAGNDVYMVDTALDTVVEAANAGSDEVRTALATYVLGANLEKLIGTAATAQDLRGNSLANVIAGGLGNDTFRLQDGGADTVNGGGGNDIIFFGNALSSVDQVDGGAGSDTVLLQGSNYLNLTLSAASLAGVETLALLTRTDFRFGGSGTPANNYKIITADANVAAGAQLLVDASALAADESLIFSGAAESDGSFRILGGRGADTMTGGAGSDTLDGGIGADAMTGGRGDDLYYVDNVADTVIEAAGEGKDEVRTALASYALGDNVEVIIGTAGTGQDLRGNALDNEIIGGSGADTLRLQDGGADDAGGAGGNDVIYYGATFGGGDSVGGGTGYDELVLQGSYSGLLFSSAIVADIEKLSLLSAGDGRFGAATADAFSYQVTIADSAVAAGTQLEVDARGLAAGEALVFDGTAESDGNFTVTGGGGADTIRGGAGNDALYGGGGDDLIEGGGGNDTIGDSGDGSDILRGQGGNDIIAFSRAASAVWATATIEGGDGNDQVSFDVSSAGAATIDLGAGADLVALKAVTGTARITLGTGQDVVEIDSLLLLTGPGRAATVTDFQAGAGGDNVVWTAALDAALQGYTPGENPFASGHARLVQDGADVLLEVSRDGDGSFLTLLRFENHQVADFTSDNFEGWSLTEHAPTVDLNGSDAGIDFASSYAEDGNGAAVADTDVAIADADAGDRIEHATVTVTNPRTGDQLTVSGALPASIHASGAGTATLILTGTASQADYQQALTQIRYASTSNDPAGGGGAPSRTITTTVNDGGVTSTAATTIVTVTGVNDAPVFTVAAGFALNEDVGRVFSTANGNRLSVSDADANPAADALSVTLSAAHGTLTLSGVGGLAFTAGDGASDAAMTFTGTANAINAALEGLSYAPLGDYNGSDLLSFSVNDLGHGGSGGDAKGDSKTINVVVNPIADVVNDSTTLAEDSGTKNLTPLANDSFENGGRAITAIGAASHGTAAINDAGTPGDAADDFVTYTPNVDYYGPDSFSYTVTSGGVTETATISLTVTAVADGVVDNIIVGEDSGRTNLDVLANDNFESSGRVVWGIGFALHGSVTYDTNNSSDRSDDFVAYTPSADYEGPDSFIYLVMSGGVTEQVVVNVTVTAAADIVADSVSVAEDSGANILNLLANDSFEDPLRAITAVGAAAHGSVTINNAGTAGDATDDYVVYTPLADYHGADAFTYTVTSHGTTETATVSLTISPVADIVDDSITMPQDTGPFAHILLGNDNFENPGRAITAVGPASHGIVVIRDSGTPMNPADDYVTYTPNAGYVGPDSFAYTITSNGATETGTVTVSVTAVTNHAPTGTDATFTIGEDVRYVFAPSDFGFLDPDGDTFISISFRASDQPTGGSLYVDYDGAGPAAPTKIVFSGGLAGVGFDLAFLTNGKLSFLPDANLNGAAAATVTFIVGDDGAVGGGNQSTDLTPNKLTFNITPANDAPTQAGFSGDIATYVEGGVPVRLDLNADAVLGDADSADFGGGSLRITIDNHAGAQDLLGFDTSPATTVTLSDGTNAGSVVSVGGAPIGSIASGGGLPQSLVISLNSAATAANVTMLLRAATYANAQTVDPLAGQRNISVVLDDGDADGFGSSQLAMSASVHVVAVNDAPAGASSTITIAEDASRLLTQADFAFTDTDGNGFAGVTIGGVTGGRLYFDADGIAGAASQPVALVGYPVTVTAADLAAGKLSYRPDANAYGSAEGSVTFRVFDDGGSANGGVDTDPGPRTISIDVTAVNDAPVNHVPGTQTIDTGGSVIFSAANGNAITVSDPDAQGNSLAVTLSVPNGALALASIANVSVTGQGTNNLSIQGTEAAVNAALDGLHYTPPSGALGPRTITVTTGDHGASPSPNLIVNPGAEAGTGAADFTSIAALPGWTVAGGAFSAVQYAAGGSDRLNAADAFALGGGEDYFAGGPGGSSSSISQLIDVGGKAAEIDAGTMRANLSGWFGGYGAENDNMVMTIRYLSTTGQQLGATQIGGVLASERAGSELQLREAVAAVPPGTRSIEIVLTANHVQGSYNDAHADNLVLTLSKAEIDTILVNVSSAAGTAGGDFFFSRQDVDDFSGLGGNDVFLFGAALTSADKVDGGIGTDQIVLQGDYSGGVTLGAQIISVESLAILPSSDNRFGGGSADLFSYDLTTVDQNVAAGVTMVVDANRLQAGEDFTFDGSAESDGSFFTYGSRGVDDLTGGAKNDAFYFGEGLQFGASDKVNGGPGGTDQLGLRGNYTIVFGASQLVSIESIGLVSAKDTRYGALGSNYNYNLTMNDGNVAAGQRMTVDGAPLRSTETLTFDGSAETDGSFRVFGGAGNDSIRGSQGADILSGGGGGDYLKGGAGADTYLYRSVADSTGTSYDRIDGLDIDADKLDLPGSHDAYQALAGGALNAGSFNSDLAAAMSGVLDPAEAMFFSPDAGDLAGKMFLIVDQNGVAGYQAGEDFVIDITGAPPPPPIIPDFIV